MLYIYEASDKEGVVIKGKIEAETRGAVIEYLEKKELIPVSIEKEGEEKGIQILSLSLFERVKPIDRVLLVRNLAAAIKAGLNIIEALDVLISDATKNIIKKILNQAKFNLQNGQALSTTFAYYKKYFPPVFVGLVRAGEASGRLESTLDELAQHLSKEYNLTRKVKSALAYPIVLLTASVSVVIMLLTFVIPRLAKSFKMSKTELPFITKALIAISNILTYSYFLDIIVIVALVWFFAYFRTTSMGRRVFLKILLRIPVARNLVKKVALVRLTRTLGSLVSSGTTIIEALGFSADAVGNETYKKAILSSSEQIRSGIALSRAFGEHSELFPRLLISMMAVGEKTGTLEKVLKTFSDFYDEEVDHTLKDLTTFIEPILLLFMGLIIGTIALSILLPIYQLVGKFV